MNRIKNLAKKPLRIPLPQGKTLHLGFGQTGQVGDDALDHPPFKELVEGGQIEVVGHGTGHTDSMPRSEGDAHYDTHGQGHAHESAAAVPRRGDRGS